MEIKKENQSAYVKFDVVEKKVTDKFETNGRIGAIMLKIKSNEMGNTMKMKIGETILTDKEFIMSCPYNPNGEMLFDSAYRGYATGKSFIEFKKYDVFEFEQLSDNVSEITVWFTKLETNESVGKK